MNIRGISRSEPDCVLENGLVQTVSARVCIERVDRGEHGQSGMGGSAAHQPYWAWALANEFHVKGADGFIFRTNGGRLQEQIEATLEHRLHDRDDRASSQHLYQQSMCDLHIPRRLSKLVLPFSRVKRLQSLWNYGALQDGELRQDIEQPDGTPTTDEPIGAAYRRFDDCARGREDADGREFLH
jgi:hypothetical protein